MSIEYTDIASCDSDCVLSSFREKNEYSCVIPYTNRQTDLFFSRILKTVLQLTKQEHFHSHLEYVVNELTANASKANSKRLYFLGKGLEIENTGDYEEGMKSFKSDVFADFTSFEEKHISQSSFIRVNFRITGKELLLIIESGYPIIEKEMMRIRERMETARKFESLAEVYTYGFDSTEGAGFGLIIILLMLRKVNLDEKALSFENSGGGSVTSLKIPLNLLSIDQGEVIADLIADELKQMPQFPQQIQNLQRELSNPNCTFESVADTINSDPTLTAEILRIANSPVYRVRNEITDIAAAVRVMGMLGVKSILYNYGMNKVLRMRYNEALVSEISSHSFMVALIGSFIARHKKLGRIAEDIYIAALLHDMGKIIVNAMNNDLEKRLEETCRNKHIPVSILDDLTEGYNHALIGAEVASRWDFPEKLVQAIKFHHIPQQADEEYRTVAFVVYLANEIFHYVQGNRDMDDLNHQVLAFFGLDRADSLNDLIGELKAEGLIM